MAENESATKNNDDDLDSQKSRQVYRKISLERLSNPEQLDNLLVVVTPKAWIALLCLISLLILTILWAFLGTIAIKIEGKGIVLNAAGSFGIQNTMTGNVKKLYVKAGDRIKAGDAVADIFNAQDSIKHDDTKILSPDDGLVLEVLVNEGDNIQTGNTIAWIEHTSESANAYLFYGYFPVEKGKGIGVGTPVQIEITTIDPQQYGYLIGKVKDVSQYAVSKESVTKTIHNKALVDYLIDESVPVVQVIVKADELPNGQFYWTSGKTPPLPITSGTICKMRATLEAVRPIYYLLPVWEFKQQNVGISN